MLRLEGLSLVGFKSFAQKADLVVPDGITCVVGPNGCGKSNIVDAITWVLGEQRARFLRGAKMEDIIFAGTRGRRPAGMAEVTLRFTPKEQAIAQVEREELDSRLLESLSVTRRLYRNGDSEYLINGQRVRLKDVNNLLQGTGLTTRAYSIIGQGRVDQILNSKPTDRRILIEEAAGITGYRARRKAAKVKLDESERSLLRVTDIVAEIEKQLRSLKRQAGAARRYRKHSGRQRVILRALFAVKHRIQTELLGAVETDLEERRQAARVAAEALGQLEEGARSSRERVAELESGRDEVSREKHELQLSIERARSTVASCRERLADNEEQTRRNERARRNVEQTLEAMGERRRERQERVERLREELAATEEDLNARLAGTREVHDRLEAAHRLIAETKENIFEAMSESAGLRNRRGEAEDSLGRLEGQAGRLNEALAAVAAEVEKLSDEVESGRQRLEEAIREEDALRERASSAASRLQDLASRLDEAVATAESSRRQLHDAEWQLAAVGETMRSRAAYRESVRRFLDTEPEGVLGTVAEFAKVEQGDELACEKALGPFLQAVVMESREAAETAVRRLAPGAEAEVHLVFPERAEAQAPERPDDDRILGPLSESLRFPDDSTSWLAGVVPGFWLVADREAAIELARRHPRQVFVSRDGAMIGPGGQGAAGRPLGDGDGILETKARAEELEAEVAKLRVVSEASEAALEELEAARAATTAEREDIRAELAEAEKGTLSCRHALEGQRKAVETAEARVSSVRFEQEMAQEELDDARERIRQYGDRLEACSKSREELDLVLEETQAVAKDLEAQASEADSTVSRLREEVAIKRERGEGARAELEPVERELQEHSERSELLASEAVALEHQKAQLEEATATAEATINNGADKWESLKASLSEAEDRVRSERQELVDSATRLRDLRLDHDDKSRQAGESEVKRERITSGLEHLVSDCMRELGLRPEDLDPPVPPQLEEEEPAAESDEVGEEEDAQPAAEVAESSTVASGDAEVDDSEEQDEDSEGGEDAANEVATPEADEAPIDESLPWLSGGELDVDLLEEEAEELRLKLSRIGPVNLVAIEEYDELAERHGFLTTERADLDASILSLRQTIEEIDATSRERFVECFEQVRETFNTCFARLFRGGRAELRLQDEEDALESGIEIIAQPPGKRLQNMLLLSGGEKALTAIALLFALFRYKPSPFCILDEVDAPLDEANVLRFVDLVNAMSDETQFLLVTHNRRSMEQGKVLYGVTMEEPGSSKLVSVSFEGSEAKSA